MTKRPAEDSDRSHLADDAATFAKDELLGARQWRRSKVGYLTGVGTITDAGRSVAGAASQGWGRIERLWAYAFRRDYGGIGISADEIADSRDRFVAAMAANGKTIEDIDHSVGVTYKQFWFYAFLMVACAIIGVGSLVFGGYRLTDNLLMNLAFAVIRFCPLLLLSVLTLRAGWTNWSFRRRRLDGVREYLRSGVILPKSAPLRAKSKATAKRTANAPSPRGTPKASVALLLLAGLIGYAGMVAIFTLPAFAQGNPTGNPVNDVFTNPPDKDLFMQLLSYVMPGVGPIPANSTTGTVGPYLPIKAGLALFSGTLLFIGMAMAGWHILTGLVASAKEGQALGRNYHEVWAPARVVIGFGMLTPMIGGLCGAQIIVLYLVAWGGNLANVVWKPYVAAVTFTPNAKTSELANQIVAENNRNLGNSTVQNLFEKYLCYYGIDQVRARGVWSVSGREARSLIPSTAPVKFTAPTSFNNNVNFMSNRIDYEMNFGEGCGKIEMSVIQPGSSSSASGDAAKFGTTSTKIDTTIEDQNSAAIANARRMAIDSIAPEIAKIAHKAAQTYQQNEGQTTPYFSPDGEAKNEMQTFVDTARDGYVRAITEAVTSQISTNASGANSRIQELRSKATEDGWASAGTFYLTISRMQANLYGAAFGGISSTPINLETNGGLSQSVLEALAGTKDRPGVMTAYRTWWERNIAPASSSDGKQAARAGASNSAWDFISNTSLAVGKVFMHLDVNPLNPMQSMIDYGNYLINWGVGIYLALSAVTGLAGFAQGTVDAAGSAPVGGWIKLIAGPVMKGIGAFAGMISPLISFAALGMIAAGAVHAFIIPLVPYILTTFFVASMLLLVVEALVAAPLWAFFHIRMDGQEFVDQVQRPGYMIAFNLILRPVLMIFGLLLSYLTFGAMSWFVGSTFMPAAYSLTASTTVGPLGAAVLVIMLAYINLQLAIKSFQLVTQIPDRVTRWFGQGGDRLGEEEDTHRHTAFLAGQLSGKMEGMARGGGIVKASQKMQNRSNVKSQDGGPAGTAKAKEEGGDAPSNNNAKLG